MSHMKEYFQYGWTDMVAQKALDNEFFRLHLLLLRASWKIVTLKKKIMKQRRFGCSLYEKLIFFTD